MKISVSEKPSAHKRKTSEGYLVCTYKQRRSDTAHIAVSIDDMAVSRSDAMDKCFSLGKNFIEHFDKIYKHPSDQSRSHWENEMAAWFGSVRGIKLKTTNAPILGGELRDWFFTAGANPQDFMKNPTYEELLAYDNFTNALIIGGNVRNALKSCITDSDKLRLYKVRTGDAIYIVRAHSMIDAIRKVKNLR